MIERGITGFKQFSYLYLKGNKTEYDGVISSSIEWLFVYLYAAYHYKKDAVNDLMFLSSQRLTESFKYIKNGTPRF